MSSFLKFYCWNRKSLWWRSILLWRKKGLKVKKFSWLSKTVLNLSAVWQHEGQTKRNSSHKTLQLDTVVSFPGLDLGTDNTSAKIRTRQNGLLVLTSSWGWETFVHMQSVTPSALDKVEEVVCGKKRVSIRLSW